MKVTRTKFAIITKERPTQFLTSTGELTGKFDEALLLEPDTVAEEIDTLDEPDKFERWTVDVDDNDFCSYGKRRTRK